MLQVLSKSPQARILDGGFGPDGERRQVRIDAKAFGTLPDWAASLPVLHRAVNRGEVQIVAGSLAPAVAPNTEPAPKAAANNEGLAVQILNMLMRLAPDERKQIAATLSSV